MNARGMGIFTGVIVGLLICLIIFKVTNKDGRIKTEYDERQQLVRATSYKIGFYTLLGYLLLLAGIELGEINVHMTIDVKLYFGIMVGVTAVVIHSIWNNAYWGINNNVKRYAVTFVLATVLNAFVSFMAYKEGRLYQDGMFQSATLNLLCTIMFILIGITIAIKAAVEKNREAEEE